MRQVIKKSTTLAAELARNKGVISETQIQQVRMTIIQFYAKVAHVSTPISHDILQHCGK